MGKYKTWIFIAIIFVLVTFYSQSKEKAIENAPMQVIFVDVGQGDSTLVVSPTGEALLIDGGSLNAAPDIYAALKSKKVESLTAVIASDLDEEHIGSLPVVFGGYDVGCFYAQNLDGSGEAYDNLQAAIAKFDVKTASLAAGDTLSLGDNVQVKVLAPTADVGTALALQVTYAAQSVIVMGDDGKDVEKALEGVQANILKVSDHGSLDSCDPQFIDSVNGGIAVISCAWDEAYGYQQQQTVDLLKKYGYDVYTTSLNGDISIKMDGAEELTVRTEKRQKQ